MRDLVALRDRLDELKFGPKPDDHVWSLGLSARAERALKFMGVETIGDLMRLSANAVENVRLPNFGRKSRNEVKEAIFQLNPRTYRP